MVTDVTSGLRPVAATGQALAAHGCYWYLPSAPPGAGRPVASVFLLALFLVMMRRRAMCPGQPEPTNQSTRVVLRYWFAGSANLRHKSNDMRNLAVA
jgi:hypothetical protein